MSSPKLSVVTVNRDMAAGLAATLDSALAQDYRDFEIIVIDGASRDGSQGVIAQRAARLAYWVSEPDSSLYEAMNKGVAAAKGEWVLFMNAGDRFAAPDVLSRVFAGAHDRADIIYGDHIRHYPEAGIERLVPAEPASVMPRRMPCSHQSLFMRRALLLAHPFDTTLLAADYEVLLAAYAQGRRFERIGCVVARTQMGGRSDTRRLQSLRERQAILRRHRLMTPRLNFYYRGLMLRAALTTIAKAVLPRTLIA